MEESEKFLLTDTIRKVEKLNDELDALERRLDRMFLIFILLLFSNVIVASGQVTEIIKLCF